MCPARMLGHSRPGLMSDTLALKFTFPVVEPSMTAHHNQDRHSTQSVSCFRESSVTGKCRRLDLHAHAACEQQGDVSVV